MQELSFESVNSKIESIDLSSLEKKVNLESVVTTSTVCEIWRKVDVIVRLIPKIPFLPKKWKDAINLLIRTLDSMCG